MVLSCEPLDFCSGEASPSLFTSISTATPLPLAHGLDLLPAGPPGPKPRRGSKSSCVPGPAPKFASVLPGRKRADDGLDEGLTRDRPLRAADEGLTYSRAVPSLHSPPEPPVPGLFSPLAGLVSPWYVESVEPGNRNADPGLAARDADSCMQTAPTHTQTHGVVRSCESVHVLVSSAFQRWAMRLDLCTCHMRANATCTRVRMLVLVRAHACVFLCKNMYTTRVVCVLVGE
jgi:hypothetical protein